MRYEAFISLLFVLPSTLCANDMTTTDEMPSAPPSYKMLRFDEDYSCLSNAVNRSDWFDPVKYIPIRTEDPDWYVSFGGELRDRFEGNYDPNFGIGSAGSDAYWLQRITALADLHLGERVRIFAEGISGLVEGESQPAPPVQDDPIDLQFAFVDLVPPEGLRLTPRHYAYLKISEGCNNRCTFCIIPHLRGDLVSRSAADVLREAERLVKAGVKELLVISQDTSAYGVDIKYAASTWRGRDVRAKFLDLARELGQFGVWVRLHYVYPYPHVDEVIPLMADGKVLPYLDVPFQHGSPAVLKRMRRPAAQEKTLGRIRAWREICPNLTVRSTFIVGFPGETDEDFALLLDWLGEAELDRVGCFRYEPVAGAAANGLGAGVPDAVKDERWHRFMQHQQAISRKRLKRKVGSREQVIIDEVGPTVAKGRSKADAPQIDGTVYVASRRPLRVGEIATVKIERADDYDLHGTAVGY